MNYSKVYMCLILNRQAQPLSENEYGEHHHIIPRSEGGSDDTPNKVKLIAREHYIAHLLLAKIYDDYAMYSALTYMQCKSSSHQRDFKFNSRLYEKMRIEFAKKVSKSKKGRHYYNNGEVEVMAFECPEGFVSGRLPYTEEALKNMKAGAKTEKHKAASRANFQKAAAMNKGKPFSEEHKRRISEATKGKNNGMYGKHLSQEAKEKISKVHKGKPKSEETKAKMKANNANKSPVIQFTKDGKFIAEYKTMAEAYQATGIRHSQIRRVILGTSSYGQFIWKYKKSSE